MQGLHVGRYELLGKLATGGMGELFVARHRTPELDRLVVVKILLPHLWSRPEYVQMFLDEARIASRMTHPNIVPVYDVGEAEGRHHIVMALVEGVSLSRLLSACAQAQRQIPLPMVRAIASGLCEGLAYAHAATDGDGQPLNVVHRDVTPSNVLLSVTGSVLLADFGIAKARDSAQVTRAGQLKGKFAYLAPEQTVAGAAIDHRADIFAAAVTIFEALTNRSPFQKESDAQTLDAVRTEQLPDVRQERPDVTEAMAQALRTATARDPAARFPSASLLGDAFLDGPVASPRELGRFVEELGAEPLKALRAARTRSDASATGSHTNVLTGTAQQTAAPAVPRPRRRLAAALIALGVLGAGAAGALLRPSLTGTPAATSAPSVAALPPQPPPATAPAAPPAERPQAAPAPSPLSHAAQAARPAPARGAQKRRGVLPAAASAAAPQAAAGTGFLSADATPWAVLLVDGREVDSTPVSRLRLSAGTHELLFRNARLGKEVRRVVTLRPNEELALRVDLTRD